MKPINLAASGPELVRPTFIWGKVYFWMKHPGPNGKLFLHQPESQAGIGPMPDMVRDAEVILSD